MTYMAEPTCPEIIPPQRGHSKYWGSVSGDRGSSHRGLYSHVEGLIMSQADSPQNMIGLLAVESMTYWVNLFMNLGYSRL